MQSFGAYVAVVLLVGAAVPPAAADIVATAVAPDVILVGVGTSGAYVLKELVPAFPHLHFLAIDAGDFVSSVLGATSPSAPPSSSTTTPPLTSVDIPGQYNNLAYTPAIDASYQMPEAPWAFQGRAWGGNANFNGALFQVPSDDMFDLWPLGWQGADLAPYYKRIMGDCNITTTPSRDGRHYVNGSAAPMAKASRRLGGVPSTSPFLPSSGEASTYGPPNVAVMDDAQRCYGTRQLSEVIDADGTSRYPNLSLLRNTQVLRVVLNGTTAVGVVYRAVGGLEETVLLRHPAMSSVQSPALASGGRVLLAAGALLTPSILMRSGIGPQSLHHEVFPDGANFTVDNEGIGVRLFDHVGAALAVECSDYEGYQSFTNSPDVLAAYAVNRSGPMAQYGPVFYHYDAAAKVELFTNPWGLDATAKQQPPNPPNHPWNNAHTFSIYAVSFDVLARSFVVLSDNGSIAYPMIYNNADEMVKLADALSTFVGALLAETRGSCVVSFGPGAPPFAGLNASNATDMLTYVNSWGPFDGSVWWSHMGMNHFGGTVPLDGGVGFGVDPLDVCVRGVGNVHVVDASLFPRPVWAHPMGTVLAVAAKAADALKAVLSVS